MLRVRDLMTRDVMTVAPDTTLRDAMETLVKHHVSGAPVVAGRKLVGVVSTTDLVALAVSTPAVPTTGTEPTDAGDWDEAAHSAEGEEDVGAPAAGYFTEFWADVGADASERMGAAAGPEWDVLSEHTVADAMSAEVYSIAPDATVPEAADLMRRHGAHRILVVEDGALLGIISTSDIARAVADGRLVRRTYVFGPARHFDERGWRPLGAR